tara:strand:+ start:482 stop:826 length:345 start_codon:yes stop_codon:yes gene_type:complete
MAERNIRRGIVKNSDKGYSEIFDKRGLTSVTQYTKMKIPSLSIDDRKDLTPMKHIYKTGDKLYKISHRYYGDTRYWWVIAWFNRKPTDFHCKIGDTIWIPFPLKEALYKANRDD